MEPTNKVRFESFSDGVFAIAITLLALELHVPALNTTNFKAADLIPLIPGIMTFVLSFIAIAIFWVNHHQLTQVFTTISKRRILWLNIFFLLFLTLIPFVTETMSSNVLFAPAISIYAFILFGASASFSWLRYWIHKSNHDGHIPMLRSVIGPIFYFLAIIAPFFSIELSYLLLAIPPLFYFLPKHSTSSL